MSEPVKQAPIDLRAYHPLARLRWTIRAYVLVEGVILALILACAWFWIATALDFCLQRFAGIDLLDVAFPVRWVLLTLFSAGIAGIVIWYIFRRLFRDFRPAALALVLEQRFPELLGDRLITAIELVNLKKAKEQGYSVEMIVKTMKDAKERVDQVPVRTVFNWRRLFLMAWALAGVSAFVLLLIYPVSVLLSLFDQPRGPALWTMLTVNALLALLIAFVFLAPCLFARLRWAMLSIVVLGAAGAAAGYDYALKHVNNLPMHEFSWRLYHATNISLDRNFLFKNTRWPRDEYFVEWFDFPVEEKRIQINKTINARAIFTTWIIADVQEPRGWRPLKWRDLPRVVDAKQIPELPLEQIDAYLIDLTRGDDRSPVGYDAAKLELPAGPDVPVDLALAVVADDNAPGAASLDRERFTLLAGALEAKAADPRLGGRLLRKVNPPESLSLNYGNDQSRQKGRSKLAALDGRPDVYALEQPVQLNDAFVIVPAEDESPATNSKPQEKKVPLIASAEVDGRAIQTKDRLVVLVRPAVVQTLTCQEFRPAYFYYLPPASPRAVTIDERRRLMRDLRQALAPAKYERPQESFEFLPNPTLGSELTLAAVTDKPLKEIKLTPRSADFPGCASKDDVLSVPLRIGPDGKSFTVQFAVGGRPLREWLAADWLRALPVPPPRSNLIGQNPVFPLVTRPITFDVAMTDVDNMPSTQTFTIKPIEDKVPNVSLYVDVIRQVQMNDRTVYLCTGKAEIPLTRESTVADDNGLHKVEFTYRYVPLANSAVVSVRAELAGWLWANTPVLPNIGDYLFRREVLQRTITGAKGPAAVEGAVRLEAFDAAQTRNLAADAILKVDDLKKKLAQPLSKDYVSPVLRKFEFKESETPVVFDLRDRLPQLMAKDAAGVIPYYELTLNVRATDSNVLSETDRTGENKEAPLVFRIVGQQDLNVFIAREEGELVRGFDEMITRLEAAQRIMQGSYTRLPSLSPSTVPSEQTRVEGVMDTLAKARERTAEIHSAYSRIKREYEVNRFPEKLTSELQIKIVRPLKDVFDKEFPGADVELIEYHKALKEGRPEIAQPRAVTMLTKVQELLDALRRIKAEMGDNTSFRAALAALEDLINGQTRLEKEDLAKIKEKLHKELFMIQVKSHQPNPVELTAGQTTKVTLNLLMPLAITTDPGLRFEVPANSGLKVAPSQIPLKNDAQQASFDLTAGTVTGTFFLKINPSQGDPFELKVVVK